MHSLIAGTTFTPRRITAGIAALALAIAAPAALAASTSPRQGIVHTHVERSGTIVVSGFDGGVPLAPAQSH